MVIVVSGAATLEVGGTTKAAEADKFGGQLVQAVNRIVSAKAMCS
jgi:hypothetical protein